MLVRKQTDLREYKVERVLVLETVVPPTPASLSKQRRRYCDHPPSSSVSTIFAQSAPATTATDSTICSMSVVTKRSTFSASLRRGTMTAASGSIAYMPQVVDRPRRRLADDLSTNHGGIAVVAVP